MDGPTLVYTRKFLQFRQKCGKIAQFAIEIKPAIVKTDQMLFATSVIASSDPKIEKYTSRGLISSLGVIIFLFIYQTRYLVLMAHDPSLKINGYFSDFLYLIGQARNGMYFGFWSTILYSLSNRVIMLRFNLAKNINLFTDWTEESKSIYNWTPNKEIDFGILRLERQLLILFELTKWSSLSLILIFTVFQGLLIYLTLVDQLNKGTLLVFPFIIWSLCLIPHTFYTATGIIFVYGMAISGILYSHYKINLCFNILNRFKSSAFRLSNFKANQSARDHFYDLSCAVADLLSTIDGHRSLFSVLFYAFTLFATLIAASFSYAAIVLELKYFLLKYCLIFASVIVWVLIICYPLKIADVAVKSNRLYKELSSQQARCFYLHVEQRKQLRNLIEYLGSTSRPIAYYMTSLTPFTYNFHFKFLVNIVSVIFLMINIWKNNK